MRYAGLGQNSGAVATEERPPSGAAGSVGVKEIPYDYVATFQLTGTRGARIQDVITISTEGTFVAVSVGCSFVPAAAAVTVPGTTPAPFDAAFTALFGGAAPLAFKAFAEATLLRNAA